MSTMASQITSLTIVCLTVYLGTDERKYQSSASLAFVKGIHRWQVNSPHKGPLTRKKFPFDDVIIRYLRNYCGRGLHLLEWKRDIYPVPGATVQELITMKSSAYLNLQTNTFCGTHQRYHILIGTICFQFTTQTENILHPWPAAYFHIQ